MCCHRTRDHVRVALPEHCDIDTRQIVVEVRDFVVAGVRTGVNVASERLASFMLCDIQLGCLWPTR